MVAHDDAVGLAGVNLLRGPPDDPRGGRIEHGHATISEINTRGSRPRFYGQYVTFARARSLFDEGRYSLWKASAIQLARYLDRPVLMEMVKQPGRHARPIMKRHGGIS
jgi:hypothetical protein